MGAAPENRDSGVWAKLRADIIRTPTRSGVEARLGVSLWGPIPYTTPLSTAPPFRQAKKKEDHQKWTTSLVNNSAKMRDMCKISHLTIANNYLYWNLGLLISRPDRVVRCWGTASSLTLMTELASDSDSRSSEQTDSTTTDSF